MSMSAELMQAPHPQLLRSAVCSAAGFEQIPLSEQSPPLSIGGYAGVEFFEMYLTLFIYLFSGHWDHSRQLPFLALLVPFLPECFRTHIQVA